MADLGVALKPREWLRLGPLTIEPATRRLLHDDGREEFLEPRVMELLVVLVKAKGAILTRDDLVNLVWSGRAIGDDAVFRALSRLRRATEAIGAGVFRIQTIAKAGYRLTCALDAASSSLPPTNKEPAHGAATRSRRKALGSAAMPDIGDSVPASAPSRPDFAPSMHRLAILPFEPVGDSPAFFAHGVAAELADQAAHIRGLGVISSVSVGKLEPRQRTPRGAAAYLGASLVLQGSVRVTADSLEIKAQLLSAPDATPIWTDTVSGPLYHADRLNHALAQRIARSIHLEVIAAPPRDVSPEAYRLYLLGQARRSVRFQRQSPVAEALLERAVAHDPGFAEAWAALGAVTLNNAYQDWVIRPRGTDFDRDRLTAAMLASDRASALRPQLPLPFVTKASAMGYLGAWTQAHQAAQGAIALGGRPAWTLMQLGQQRRAVELAQRECELNPLDYHAQYLLSYALFSVGAVEAAAAAGCRAFATRTPQALHNLLVQLIELRRFAEARELLDFDPALLVPALIQFAPTTREFFRFEVGDGPRPDPADILARVDRGDGYHEMAALLFARMGALRHASMMLERMGSYELPVIYMIFSVRGVPLRRLPAFGRLMQRIGLATFWRQTGQHPDFRFATPAS